MVFFTSDLHLGHTNIIKFCNRPFSSVKEMDETIIKNWNRTVGKNDTVYVLGDFTMLKNSQMASDYIEKLNGKIFFLKGNHDHWMKNYDFSNNNRVFNFGSYHEESFSQRRFILCHYPFLEWNHYYKGSYHLHGHQHNNEEYNENNIKSNVRRYDVGVDANNFAPVSVDKIINFFES